MTSEMVERVAKAMKVGLQRQSEERNAGAICVYNAEYLDSCGVDGEVNLLMVACAAIAAMREPTEAMRQAGRVPEQFEELRYATNQSEDCLLDGFVDAYKAMIDEALKP